MEVIFTTSMILTKLDQIFSISSYYLRSGRSLRHHLGNKCEDREPLDISTNLAPTARYSYAAIYLHGSFLSVFMLIPGFFYFLVLEAFNLVPLI
jgi:hypothetical protein